MDQVRNYIKNHQEAYSGTTVMIFGVNSNDMLKVIDNNPMAEKWDVVYYIKVSQAISNVKRLFP